MDYLTYLVLLRCFCKIFLLVKSQPLDRQKRQSYISCQLDQDCKDSAFCYRNDNNKLGKCKCFEGYELIRNSTYYECLPGVKLGEACNLDIQCAIIASELAICNEQRICECSPKTHQAPNDICYTTVAETCISDNNCYLGDGKYGNCTAGTCACPPGQIPSQNKSHCIPLKKIGEACGFNEECEDLNTECSDVCRCKGDYVLSQDETQCLKAATAFGESCSYDGQCSAFLNNSICLNQTCSCATHHHQYGIRCVQSKEVGEFCTEDIECIYEPKLENNVQCSGASCVCTYGKASDGTCNEREVNSSSLTKTCLSDNDCYLGYGQYGSCSSGRCACPLGQIPSQNNTHCISGKKLGEACVLDEECVHLNTRCSDVCRCQADYVLSRNETGCLKAATGFGKSCFYDAQCSVFLTNSICINETCTCATHQHQHGIRCVQSKGVGEYCTEDLECIYEPKLENNVKCTGASCVCTYGTASDGTCNIENLDYSSSIRNYSRFSIILLNTISFSLLFTFV